MALPRPPTRSAAMSASGRRQSLPLRPTDGGYWAAHRPGSCSRSETRLQRSESSSASHFSRSSSSRLRVSDVSIGTMKQSVATATPRRSRTGAARQQVKRSDKPLVMQLPSARARAMSATKVVGVDARVPSGRRKSSSGTKSQDFACRHVIEQQAARGRPRDRHLDADVGGDLEDTRAVAHVDDHIFVAAQRAELRRRLRLRGKPVERFAAAPVQRIGIGIGAAVEVHRLAEIDVPFVADRLEDAGLDQPVDDRIERRARRPDPSWPRSPIAWRARRRSSASRISTARSMPFCRSRAGLLPRLFTDLHP